MFDLPCGELASYTMGRILFGARCAGGITVLSPSSYFEWILAIHIANAWSSYLFLPFCSSLFPLLFSCSFSTPPPSQPTSPSFIGQGGYLQAPDVYTSGGLSYTSG